MKTQMDVLTILAKMTEKAATSYLTYQNTQPGTRDYGGLIPPDRGYCEPGSSAGAFDYLVSLREYDGSSLNSDVLEASAHLYIDHLLSCQHSDGTLDLRETNFHCTATLAFTLQYLSDTYRLLARSGSAFASSVAPKLKDYILAGIPALSASGFHTPNHRWVIASAISHVLELGEESLLDLSQPQIEGLSAELDRYLGEGIDMDEYGEYTEKSTGIYNVACNDSLLIMARRGAQRDLLKYVKRNLDLMPSYVEPDGSLFTMKSTRQDSGIRLYPHGYFANYLEYGLMADDEFYRATGLWLLSDAVEKSVGSARNMLSKALVNPEIINNLPDKRPLAPVSSYFNPGFGLARLVRGGCSVTAAAKSTRFLKYQKGSNAVMIRVAATFFGTRGRFIPESITANGEAGYLLSQTSEWGYTRPFSAPPESPVWADMDHGSREPAYMHTFSVTAGVDVADREVTLLLDLDGPQDMLYKIDFIFSPGGVFESNDIVITGVADSGLILKSNRFTYRLGTDTITVDGGFAEHARARDLRGGEPQDASGFTVYCTGYAPDKRRITFS